MKYVKSIGLAAVVAAALMAFAGAGTASASVLCKTNLTSGCATTGWDYPTGTEIEATLEMESSAYLVAGGFIEDTCTGSTFKGVTSTTGSTSGTVSVKATALTWTGCDFTTVTNQVGTLEIHWISGTDNGTLTASGFEVTVKQPFGTCVYKSGTGNDLGPLNGGSSPTIVTATTVTGSGSFGCPSTAAWSAVYQITKPTPLFVSTS